MSSPVAELRDYEEVRALTAAHLLVVTVHEPVVVLGSSQDQSLLREPCGATLRRRRGGGGLVEVHPGDLWVDWWIPRGDRRWREDLHASAQDAARRWSEALAPWAGEALSVHVGRAESDPRWALACFAGRGPGEIFLDDRKLVGLTQWRVREGVLVSTVAPRRPHPSLLDRLAEPPEGLAGALEHAGLDDLSAPSAEVLERLLGQDGPWSVLTQAL